MYLSRRKAKVTVAWHRVCYSASLVSQRLLIVIQRFVFVSLASLRRVNAHTLYCLPVHSYNSNCTPTACGPQG